MSAAATTSTINTASAGFLTHAAASPTAGLKVRIPKSKRQRTSRFVATPRAPLQADPKPPLIPTGSWVEDRVIATTNALWVQMADPSLQAPGYYPFEAILPLPIAARVSTFDPPHMRQLIALQNDWQDIQRMARSTFYEMDQKERQQIEELGKSLFKLVETSTEIPAFPSKEEYQKKLALVKSTPIRGHRTSKKETLDSLIQQVEKLLASYPAIDPFTALPQMMLSASNMHRLVGSLFDQASFNHLPEAGFKLPVDVPHTGDGVIIDPEVIARTLIPHQLSDVAMRTVTAIGSLPVVLFLTANNAVEILFCERDRSWRYYTEAFSETHDDDTANFCSEKEGIDKPQYDAWHAYMTDVKTRRIAAHLTLMQIDKFPEALVSVIAGSNGVGGYVS